MKVVQLQLVISPKPYKRFYWINCGQNTQCPVILNRYSNLIFFFKEIWSYTSFIGVFLFDVELCNGRVNYFSCAFNSTCVHRWLWAFAPHGISSKKWMRWVVSSRMLYASQLSQGLSNVGVNGSWTPMRWGLISHESSKHIHLWESLIHYYQLSI